MFHPLLTAKGCGYPACTDLYRLPGASSCCPFAFSLGQRVSPQFLRKKYPVACAAIEHQALIISCCTWPCPGKATKPYACFKPNRPYFIYWLSAIGSPFHSCGSIYYRSCGYWSVILISASRCTTSFPRVAISTK
jgi:hypothetical protein